MNFMALAIHVVKIFLAGVSVVVVKLQGSKIVYKQAQLILVGKQLLNKWFLWSEQCCKSKLTTCLLSMVILLLYVKWPSTTWNATAMYKFTHENPAIGSEGVNSKGIVKNMRDCFTYHHCLPTFAVLFSGLRWSCLSKVCFSCCFSFWLDKLWMNGS